MKMDQNADQNAGQPYDAKQEPPSWINEIRALMSHRKYRKTLVGHFQIENKVDKLDFFETYLRLSLSSLKLNVSYEKW